jgi:hypothetical protein
VLAYGNDEDEIRHMAETLTFGPPAPAHVPYTFGYLPAGWRPTEVDDSPSGEGPTTYFVGSDPCVTITVMYRSGIVLNGREVGILDGHRLTAAEDGTGTILVDLGNGAALALLGVPELEREKLLRGMRFADAKDRTTWFDATTAIPGEPVDQKPRSSC